MRPYYTTDHRRAWARIQAAYEHDKARGLRMAAAFGRKLAARDLRRAARNMRVSPNSQIAPKQTRTLAP
jgi:hypothetical protein